MTGIIFVLAAAAWVILPLVLKEFENYDDAIVGIAAGIVLFILPADNQRRTRLLDWKTANEMPWDVLLLFGGGLSLSSVFNSPACPCGLVKWPRGLASCPLSSSSLPWLRWCSS